MAPAGQVANIVGDGTEQSPCQFVNGGLNPQSTSESGVAAPAGFFWSEVQHDTGNTTQSNTNAGYADTQGTLRLADDFTLTQPCTINSVVFYGYLTGAPASPRPLPATPCKFTAPVRVIRATSCCLVTPRPTVWPPQLIQPISVFSILLCRLQGLRLAPRAKFGRTRSRSA